ncbi:transglycosylase family protein [Streptomyces sp. NPDC052052]|uniref:transglycosylase family protein n=1 Tax=Streptomyces sp. NPDC052052 TaxID=3154756 RepID=UPI003427C40D
MGSANGRHRRPRQAPAIVVAAGVTGSAIAIPLLGAAGAHAADATTWDRVADCESGGTWSADFGNGSYGGLQLSPEVWKANGGESYAPSADLASRAQQIAVAEKVLEDRGPKAWPSCAVISGLTTDGTLPGVDPGSVPSVGLSDDVSSGKGHVKDAQGGDTQGGEAQSDDAQSDETTPSAKPSAAVSTAPSAKASESSASSDSPDSSASSDASQSSDSAASPSRAGGKHRGAAASEGRGHVNGGERESGRHASRSDAGARQAGADGSYAVHAGDNLWTIADAQNVPGGWSALYEANKGVVGSDPDLILPGQSLDLEVKAP